jgi:hypothetical protein
MTASANSAIQKNHKIQQALVGDPCAFASFERTSCGDKTRAFDGDTSLLVWQSAGIST